MKQKVLSFLKANKGSISLLLITLAVTLIFGLFINVITGACFGVLTLTSIEYLTHTVGMQLGDSNRPGIVGIVMGTLILSL